MSYAQDRDDELYGGYDEASNPLAGNSGAYQALGADGAVPGTAMRPPGTAMKTFVAPGTAAGRMGTAMQAPGGGDGQARPMTSNRGAGFSSVPNKKYDPLNRNAGSSSGVLAKKGDATAEEQAKDQEKKVHALIEESAVLVAKADVGSALEKAMEAKKREKALSRFREQNNMADQINVDLTYAVDFNLAHAYHMNKNYTEALAAYTAIVKNKSLPQSGRLRVNMGNIYFEQKKYTNAIKMYRMALDQIHATAKEVRFKIMRNIGLSFVRMGQYQDALQHFNTVMDNVPDHQTGYNLVVCNFALGDRDGMRDSFTKLIEVSPPVDDEEDDGMPLEEEEDDLGKVVQDDGLREHMRKKVSATTRLIVKAAQLISERIDKAGGFEAGYNWCVEQLRACNYTRAANHVELAKASRYMSSKAFESAIGVFKEFEKKEPRVKAAAATNLAFLYVLEGDQSQADKFADVALKTDRYNARAFVNKGCVLVGRGDLEGARSLFNEAAGIDPYCVEAIFNLGLVSMRLGELPYALAAFKKLHAMLPDNVEVIYQIANTYDMMGDFRAAVKWMEMLSSLVPNDPGVLARLGAIHARFDDEARALHYYQESQRVFPVNMDVISWLGAYHVRNEVYEKALPFFDLASRIQPQEVKWALMVASCHRRTANYPAALAKYKQVHTDHPDNIECLRYLVHLCTELGRRAEAQEFMTKLKRAEKSAHDAATTAAAAQMRPLGGGDGGMMGGGMGMGMGGMGGGEDSMSRMAAEQAPRRDMGMGGMGMGGGMGGDLSGGGGRMMGDDDGLGQGMGGVPTGRGKKIMVKEQMGGGKDDDWGNEALGEDLLPM